MKNAGVPAGALTPSNPLPLQDPPARGEDRLRGLDGLRGAAMLMVIFCHLQLFNVGWTGLQSFFVLSGFLITRILLKDTEHATSFGDYLKRFYIRRFLRVFPIYYSYLLVLTVAAQFASGLAQAKTDLPFAYLYVYNFRHLAADHAGTRALDHLWSLSVEEQFYLIWPFVIAFARGGALKLVLLTLVATGPALRGLVFLFWPPSGALQWTPNAPLAIYVLTSSHIDAFAIGALINFIDYRPRLWHLLVTVVGALVLGMATNGLGVMPSSPWAPYFMLGWPLFMANAGQSVWGYTVVDFFWFQVISAILHVPSIRDLFSNRVLDYLGKRSYATYIVHYPLLGLYAGVWYPLMHSLGRVLGTLALLPFYLPVVFALAALSYRFIETPMLRLKDRFASQKRTDSPERWRRLDAVPQTRH